MTNRKSGSKSTSPKAKPRLKVELGDSLISAVHKLAYGNDKVGALLSRAVMTMTHNEAIEFLHTISNLELYGEDVWIAYAVCNSDLDWFVAAMTTKDSTTLKEIEKRKVQKLAGILKISSIYVK